MAALRRHVFVEKVLKRLFPSPCGQEKSGPVTAPSEQPAERAAAAEVTGSSVPTVPGDGLADADTKVSPRRRFYTASLPPEGYIPAPPEPQGSPASEDTSGSDDVGGACQVSDEDLHAQPKRRRARKHKSRKSLKNANNDGAERAEVEKQQSLLPENLQPRHADGPTISKNKRRKLKKQQQMKRKKAAGLTAASGGNFTYQPEEGDSEWAAGLESDGAEDAEDQAEDHREDHTEDGTRVLGEGYEEDGARVFREDDGEDGGPALGEDYGEDGTCVLGEDRTDTHEEDPREDHREDDEDTSGEDVKNTNEKADDILNFLKSTQEIYFYDGMSRAAASAVSAEATQELFRRLGDHSVSRADVLLMHHMKTLLLLRDTESLRLALDRLPALCTLPPDHASVLSAFFNYWITHILPENHTTD
nr:glutamate-rich protein 1 isoform X3 [Vulpes vulpes]